MSFLFFILVAFFIKLSYSIPKALINKTKLLLLQQTKIGKQYMSSLHSSYFNFFLKPLPLALVGLFISFHTYSQQQEKDSIFSNSETLEEVVVTGQYQAQSLRQSVYQIKVIDEKKIEYKAATNLQQVLNGELGISFSNDMAVGASNISYMGMGGRNIKILVNGVPLLDRGDMRESLNQIDISQIKRIEIVQGPMAIIYGSDALSGVINIVTKELEQDAWYLQASVQEESAGKEYFPGTKKGLHVQQINAGYNEKSWQAKIGLMHYDFYGYGADSLDRDHIWKPKTQWIPSLELSWQKSDYKLHYHTDYLQESIASKSKINWGNYKATNQYFYTDRWSHSLQYNQRGINSKWDAMASFVDYKRQTRTNIIDYSTKTSSLSTRPGDQDLSVFKSAIFRANYFYEWNPKLSTQVGTEYNYDQADGDRILGSPDIHNIALYGTAEYKPIQKLKIKPGIRWAYNSVYPAPPLIPSLNVLYHFNDDLSVRAAYTRGFRAPALRELYFNFQDVNHNIVGNTNLKAEFSNSLTASVLFTKFGENEDMYITELGVFYNEYHNLIDYALNPNNPNEYIMLNVADYSTMGIQLEQKYQYGPLGLKIGAILLGQYNLAAATPELRDSVSKYNWTTEASAEINYTFPQTKTNLNLFYKFSGRQNSFSANTDANNNWVAVQNTRDPYHNADFSVIQPLFSGCTLSLGVRNIFDVTTIKNTSQQIGAVHNTVQDINFNYGRSYFLKLNYSFNSKTK